MRSDVFADDVFGNNGYVSINLPAAPREARRAQRGGARRDRTDDLLLAKQALSQLSYGPQKRVVDVNAAAHLRRLAEPKLAQERRLVGLGRLELPTSRLSSARSNQLSYKPLTLIL